MLAKPVASDMLKLKGSSENRLAKRCFPCGTWRARVPSTLTATDRLRLTAVASDKAQGNLVRWDPLASGVNPNGISPEDSTQS